MKTYQIGTPDKPWSATEKQQWLSLQKLKRSYAVEVLTKLSALSDELNLVQYGALSHAPERYPLFIIHSKQFDTSKRTALITGGVHGYETSGVQGALSFALNEAPTYLKDLNIIIAPCISPWGYETINRWNPTTVDPNRSFHQDAPCEESTLLMAAVASLNTSVDLHIDLHETTDTDNSEFRPALAARDAIPQKKWHIPDGFYLVGDIPNPQPEFQKAIVQAVEQVTHIAPADEDGKIIGDPTSQHGVINYDKKKLFLCAGLTNAKFVTTTEVYPDSKQTTPENCIQAQVTAVCAALDFLINVTT